MSDKLLVAVSRRDDVPPDQFEKALLATGAVVSLPVREIRHAPRADAFLEMTAQPALPDVCSAVTVYHVAPRVKLDGPRDGVKAMYFALRRDSLSRDEFDRYWSEQHAPLALRHHIGMSRYVQNAVLDHTGDCLPDVDGIAELWFPTMAAFEEKFIDSPEGMAVIEADVVRFAKSRGVPMHLVSERL